MNIGIVGYGNLGKAVERTLKTSDKHNLVAIFSRRNVLSELGTPVVQYETLSDFVGKIDVMLLCGGSKNDLLKQTPEVVQHFDVINTFDTHKKIPEEFDKIDGIAKQTNHRAILCCGWDPGLFSVMRALFFAVGQENPTTFWGKGVSLGHSDAIRQLDGVVDAVQFTIPNEEAVQKLMKGEDISDLPLHFRECFVATDCEDKDKIKTEIENIPNYFLGQPTIVHFVDEAQVKALKQSMYHKGEVVSSFLTASGDRCKMSFETEMDSNPDFTASIVCAYANAIPKLRQMGFCGACTSLDIAPSLLFEDQLLMLKTFC